MVMLDQTAPHVNRQSQTLEKFEEFVLVLMKLKLNMPFQDLVLIHSMYCCSLTYFISLNGYFFLLTGQNESSCGIPVFKIYWA